MSFCVLSRCGIIIALPDAGEGLGTRLWHAVRREASVDAILAAAQTRRYPLSRIRRLCLCACLGVKAGMSHDAPPYARVLAANARGREILRERSGRGSLPVLTKPASVRELGREAEALFALARTHTISTSSAIPALRSAAPGRTGAPAPGSWRSDGRISGLQQRKLVIY